MEATTRPSSRCSTRRRHPRHGAQLIGGATPTCAASGSSSPSPSWCSWCRPLRYPAIAGDNLLQNFPLRALSGRLHGRGAPPAVEQVHLVGLAPPRGLNAGSFYLHGPVHRLRPGAAWGDEPPPRLLGGGDRCLRALAPVPLARLACLLAAATYAFGGPMAGQMVPPADHPGLGLDPLHGARQLRLSWQVFDTGPRGTVPARRGSAWPWVVLLAVTLA